MASDPGLAVVGLRGGRTFSSQRQGGAPKLGNAVGLYRLDRQLSRSGDPYFNGLGALAHGYSMASHVQHVDMVGASIALERDRRSVERRESIHLAHEGRLLSDLLDFLFLRMGVGYRFVAADLSQLAEVKAAIDDARAPFRQAAEHWLRIEYPGTRPGAA